MGPGSLKTGPHVERSERLAAKFTLLASSDKTRVQKPSCLWISNYFLENMILKIIADAILITVGGALINPILAYSTCTANSDSSVSSRPVISIKRRFDFLAFSSVNHLCEGG